MNDIILLYHYIFVFQSLKLLSETTSHSNRIENVYRVLTGHNFPAYQLSLASTSRPISFQLVLLTQPSSEHLISSYGNLTACQLWRFFDLLTAAFRYRVYFTRVNSYVVSIVFINIVTDGMICSNHIIIIMWLFYTCNRQR